MNESINQSINQRFWMDLSSYYIIPAKKQASKQASKQTDQPTTNSAGGT